jgi:hypothetical protein
MFRLGTRPLSARTSWPLVATASRMSPCSRHRTGHFADVFQAALGSHRHFLQLAGCLRPRTHVQRGQCGGGHGMVQGDEGAGLGT